MDGSRRHQIVVLGGGFGGIAVTQELHRLFGGSSRTHVTLINRDNFFVFQPMLAEVAGSSIEAGHIVSVLRHLCPGTRCITSEVLAIDLAGRSVLIRRGQSQDVLPITFDTLVLALGTVVDLQGLPGMAEHALSMKTLGDAYYLRNHVIRMLEEAEAEPDPAARRRLLTFVVVGAGFSGVETVAELNDLIRLALRWYPAIDRSELQVVLLHSRDRILPELSTSLALFAQKKLKDRGIVVRLGMRVAAATPDEVVLKGGEKIATRTIVSTVGNGVNPLVRALPCAHDRRGNLVVDATMAVPGCPGVWALGDCASVPNPATGEPYPPTAQHATREGIVLARNIAATLDGKPTAPFRYRALGQLASLGRRSAVAEIGGLRFAGLPAWGLWRTVYLLKLPRFDRKLRVALDWSLDLLFPRDLVSMAMERWQAVIRAHYEPGEEIIREGEPGDRFYVIVQGEVDVLKRDGATGEAMLATLGPGDYFGETALLRGGRRTATVRCRTPVDVLALARDDFSALASHWSRLQTQLEERIRGYGAGTPVDVTTAPADAPSG